jgi:hypothetical protein
MGRSQVKYNRTHGRSGTKGRVGRGGGRTESTPGRAVKPQQQQQQGDNNAWRFEIESESSTSAGPGSIHLEQLLHLETSGLLPQYSEKLTEDDDESSSLLFVKEINLSSMGKTLAQLSVAERLSIPARLTVDLEVRSVREESHPKHPLSCNNDPVDEKVDKTGSSGNELVDVEDDDAEDDDDDDLGAWLDTVIA